MGLEGRVRHRANVLFPDDTNALFTDGFEGNLNVNHTSQRR